MTLPKALELFKTDLDGCYRAVVSMSQAEVDKLTDAIQQEMSVSEFKVNIALDDLAAYRRSRKA